MAEILSPKLLHQLERANEHVSVSDGHALIIVETESIGIIFEVEGIKYVRPLRQYTISGPRKTSNAQHRDMISLSQNSVNTEKTYYHDSDPYTVRSLVIYEDANFTPTVCVLYTPKEGSLRGIEFIRPLYDFVTTFSEEN